MLESLLQRFGLKYSTDLLIHFLLPISHILVILILELIALKLVDSALKRVWAGVSSRAGVRHTRVEQRTETLRHIVGSVGKIVIWTAAIIMIIHEFGLDTSGILTGAGILGLAVGFGAQSLVKDVIAGFFILLEDQYGVGDVVRIGDHDGVVEHMTLRITTLRNFEGHVHIIPNGAVSTVTVTAKDWARAVVDVTVPHGVEIGRLFKVLESAAGKFFTENKGRVLEAPEILGVEKLSEEGATVRLAVKTLPENRATVTREWRRRIREALDDQGIMLVRKP